jgi:hypothetical protein
MEFLFSVVCGTLCAACYACGFMLLRKPTLVQIAMLALLACLSGGVAGLACDAVLHGIPRHRIELVQWSGPLFISGFSAMMPYSAIGFGVSWYILSLINKDCTDPSK